MPSLPYPPAAPLCSVSRSGRTESLHRGAVAVFGGGRLLLALGDVDQPVVCRSATKPLQLLPLLLRSIDARLGLSAAEIAVACASHDGTERHVQAVRSLLAKAGLDEAQLGCGPHAPFDPASRRELLQRGQRPLRVHNNCSGKHSAFLCLGQDLGDDLGSYLEPTSRGQTLVAETVAAMAGLEGLPERGVDGCAAPTFVLPLRALARSFAQFSNPDAPGDVVAACRKIQAAVKAEPAMLAGDGRLCTELVRMPQVAFAKKGAEGVYAVGLLPDPARRLCPEAIGIAIKVEDGAERGYQPVVVDLLRWLGALPAGLPLALAAYEVLPVRNTLGDQVGEVRSIASWEGP